MTGGERLELVRGLSTRRRPPLAEREPYAPAGTGALGEARARLRRLLAAQQPGEVKLIDPPGRAGAILQHDHEHGALHPLTPSALSTAPHARILQRRARLCPAGSSRSRG
jgi:hypothetical protein